MKYTFKRPLLLKIIFFLSTIFTVLGLYLLIKKMIIDDEAQMAIKMYSSKISPDQIYIGVGLITSAFILKWVGAFVMFNRKPWGYILFFIPNLIFLASLVYLIIYGFTQLETISISSITFIMMVLYTVELFQLIKLRKRSNNFIQ